jgi:hypothetical protein
MQFTNEQVDHICYQIGEWYFKWKNNLIESYEDKTHNLGRAKEDLKIMIFGDTIDQEISVPITDSLITNKCLILLNAYKLRSEEITKELSSASKEDEFDLLLKEALNKARIGLLKFLLR